MLAMTGAAAYAYSDNRSQPVSGVVGHSTCVSHSYGTNLRWLRGTSHAWRCSSQLIVIVEILGGIGWVAHNIDGVSIQNGAYLRVVIRGNIIRLLYGLTKNSK